MTAEKLVQKFNVSLETGTSDEFFSACSDLLCAEVPEMQVRGVLQSAMTEAPVSLGLMGGDPEGLVVSAAVEKGFFNALSEYDFEGTRYTLSAIQFETDELFSPSTLTKEFFQDISAYLKKYSSHNFETLHLLSIPFVWVFEGQVPFGALYHLAQDILRPVAHQALTPQFSEQLFGRHLDIVSRNIKGQESFWLFVVGVSESDNSFGLPSIEDIVEDQQESFSEIVNTKEEDQYLEDTYGVYLPRLDLETIATIITEKFEDSWSNDFLANLVDLIHAGVSKNSDFLLELSSISCDSNGTATVKFYSDDFDHPLSLDFIYSEWTPDRMIDAMVLSCLDMFLTNNPRYSKFVELPGPEEFN